MPASSCASTRRPAPNLPGVSAPISRPRAVTVRFLNQDGVEEDRDFVGLWATSVQHQIDHLAGRMYVDHLTPLRRKMLSRGRPSCTAADFFRRME